MMRDSRPDHALVTVEQVRKAEVDTATLALAAARKELQLREAALGAHQRRRLELESALRLVRERALSERDVQRLRWAEDHARGLSTQLDAVGRALTQLAAAREAAREEVARCKAALLEREVGRRAVGRALEQRAVARAKADERRDEDHADDLVRATTKR